MNRPRVPRASLLLSPHEKSGFRGPHADPGGPASSVSVSRGRRRWRPEPWLLGLLDRDRGTRAGNGEDRHDRGNDRVLTAILPPACDRAKVRSHGKGKLSGIPGGDHVPPFPALARSDRAGRFLATGIPAGAQPVQVRAVGFRPWLGNCDIVAGLTVPLRIAIGPGATIRGTVRDATIVRRAAAAAPRPS